MQLLVHFESRKSGLLKGHKRYFFSFHTFKVTNKDFKVFFLFYSKFGNTLTAEVANTLNSLSLTKLLKVPSHQFRSA